VHSVFQDIDEEEGHDSAVLFGFRKLGEEVTFDEMDRRGREYVWEANGVEASFGGSLELPVGKVGVEDMFKQSRGSWTRFSPLVPARPSLSALSIGGKTVSRSCFLLRSNP
jgi:hypothetical protein